jgi:hypothetical protein
MSRAGFDQGLQIEGEKRDPPKPAAKEPTAEAIISPPTDSPATVTLYTPTLSPSGDVPSLQDSRLELAPTAATGFSPFTGPAPTPQSLYDFHPPLNPYHGIPLQLKLYLTTSTEWL